MRLVETILLQMSRVKKPQRYFLMILLTTLMRFQGKANFRNLSRQSELHEKSYARGFRRSFDFVEFNQRALEPIISETTPWIAVVDCSFIKKSGKHTYGLGKFYNSQHGRTEKGLEVSTLALVDVKYNTAYHLSTQQTAVQSNDSDETRVDLYLEQLQRDRDRLPAQVHHLVADGYYSKTKFINGVAELGLFQIGKLRHDASLRWLYQGHQKPRGRPKLYDGKVLFTDLTRFESAGEENGMMFYTAVVNSPCFQRNLRIVYVLKSQGKHLHTALLFSTDLLLSAADIYRFYKARFQIEFLFRDAKQFTGWTDCQSRQQHVLDFHLNASMTALNLIKLKDRSQAPLQSTRLHPISIASWKIRNSHEYLLQRFSFHLALDFNAIKSSPFFQYLCNSSTISSSNSSTPY